MAEANNIFNKYMNMASAPNVFRQGRVGHPNEQFPVQLSTTDPEDQKWALREKIVNQAGDVPNIGKAIAPEAYWDYAQRKENADLLFQFQQFVMQQADLSTPESANWWYTKFPWMRELRLQQIYQQSELQKRFAEIAVTGPQNQDDFMLMWMRFNNLLKVSDKVPEKLYDDDDIISRNYQNGFFSPLAKQIPATDPSVGGKINWSSPLGGRTDPINFPTITPPTGANLASLWRAPTI